MDKWILANIKKKECIRYVCSDKPDTQQICVCGRTEEQHTTLTPRTQDTGDPSVEWNPNEDIAESPTDAFGEISFIPRIGNRKSTKYVRLEENTDPKLILELLMKQWNLPRPKLVISVIGGRKNLELSSEGRTNFNRALQKASQTACTWILTAGTNCGVTKCVGEAVKEGQSIKWKDSTPVNTINCIGIAPWSYVENTDCLVRKPGGITDDGTYNTEYSHLKPVIRSKPVPLNPNHTHYLLVDDGIKNRSGGADIRLRSKIEKAIQDERIPLVLVVLEGGIDSLKHIRTSAEQGIPIVVCNGTGRTADIISYAHSQVNDVPERQLNPSALAKITESLQTYSDAVHHNIEDLVEDVSQCVKHEGLITVFEMDGDKHKDMNLAIMTALLDGQMAEPPQQLSLAISWNRADIAERIFAKNPNLTVDDEFITRVLVEDKVDFLKLFIARGAILKEYLTDNRLSELYNNEVDAEDILQLIMNVKREKCETTTLDDIWKLFGLKTRTNPMSSSQVINSSDIVNLPKTDDSKIDMEMGETLKVGTRFAQPYLELFLWAVITNRVEMAKYFWVQGSNPISAAIYANKLLKTMSKHTKDSSDRQETILQNAEYFGGLATGVINECYHTNKEFARKLIECRQPHWKNKTPLVMAAEAENKDFISHPCCKSKLDDDWYGQLLPSLNRGYIVPAILTIFFPLLVIFKLHFKDQGDKQPRWYRKPIIFLQAPVTKFWKYSIFYVAFLLLYSYVLLFRFKRDDPMILDIVLFVWIIIMIVEEVRAIIPDPETNQTLRYTFSTWIGYKWNKIDLLMLTIAISGFCLQWNNDTHEIARTMYAANSFILYTRVLRMFAVSERLGPKMVMIERMLVEMLFFLCILFVFLVSYGVASRALLYPNQELTVKNVKQIIALPYFQVYGEFLDKTVELDTCELDDHMCPQEHLLVPIMLGIYLLLGNVLLMNLLIAIFSSVYAEIESNSVKVWKYELYFLVMEMKNRPILPPPLIIIEYAYRTVRWIYKRCRPCATSQKSFMENSVEVQYLHIFEQDCAMNYMNKRCD